MLRAAAGEKDAVGPLFDRHADGLYAYFMHLLGDRATALDLVQTVFERILRYSTSFRAEASFRTWMFQIARNVQHTHFRRRAAIRQREEAWAEAVQPDPSPEEETQLRVLERALRDLPPDKREILLLAKYSGLRYCEIAGLLSSTEGAVKVRVYRALEALRERCDELIQEQSDDT